MSDSRASAWSVSRASCAVIASKPMASTYSIAALRPMASMIAGVPASNLWGISAQVLRSKLTEPIMSPPPMKGGMASKSSRRAHSTPMPVGPYSLCPVNR